MSRQESLLISGLVKAGTTKYAIREGITPDHFLTYKEEYEWLFGQPSVPSKAVFAAQFPDFRWRNVKTDDIPTIVAGLKEGHIKAKLARIIEMSAKNLKKRTGQETAEDLRKEIHGLLQASGTSGVYEIIEDGKDAVAEFKKKQQLADKGQMYGIPTGFPTIDRVTGGLLPSQLFAIIARQGNAKTYLMLRWAAEAVLAGKRVLWVSREMPEDMVTFRVHTIMSTMLRGVDNSFSNLSLILGRKDVDYNDYRDFVRNLKKKTTGRLFIPRDRRVTINQISQYADRYAPDLIFYDYLGIIGSGEGGRSWAELGAQASTCKEIAMEHHVPFVIASQVNRATKDNDGEAPMVENISYSDAIGYACDRIFSLNLTNFDEDTKLLEIWIRKARYGDNDINVVVQFNGDRGHLVEIESPKELAEIMEDDDDDDAPDVQAKKKVVRLRKSLLTAA